MNQKTLLEQLNDGRSISAVAKLLNVHQGTIYRWIFSGVRGKKLPSVLCGGRRRILSADLDNFLATETQKPDDLTDRAKVAREQLRSFGIERKRPRNS